MVELLPLPKSHTKFSKPVPMELLVKLIVSGGLHWILFVKPKAAAGGLSILTICLLLTALKQPPVLVAFSVTL